MSMRIKSRAGGGAGIGHNGAAIRSKNSFESFSSYEDDDKKGYQQHDENEDDMKRPFVPRKKNSFNSPYRTGSGSSKMIMKPKGSGNSSSNSDHGWLSKISLMLALGLVVYYLSSGTTPPSVKYANPAMSILSKSRNNILLDRDYPDKLSLDSASSGVQQLRGTASKNQDTAKKTEKKKTEKKSDAKASTVLTKKKKNANEKKKEYEVTGSPAAEKKKKQKKKKTLDGDTDISVKDVSVETPTWTGSKAESLLKQDLMNDKTNRVMKPVKLQYTRPEYQEFTFAEFRDHLEKEVAALDANAKDANGKPTPDDESATRATIPSSDILEADHKMNPTEDAGSEIVTTEAPITTSPSALALNNNAEELPAWKILLGKDLQVKKNLSLRLNGLQALRPEYEAVPVDEFKIHAKELRKIVRAQILAAKATNSTSVTKSHLGAPAVQNKTLTEESVANIEEKTVAVDGGKDGTEAPVTIDAKDAAATGPPADEEKESSERKQDTTNIALTETSVNDVPVWRTLLREDLMIEENMKMKPIKLHATREEYLELSLPIWRKVLEKEKEIVQAAVNFLKEDLANENNQHLKAFELQKTRPEYEELAVKEFRKLFWMQKEALPSLADKDPTGESVGAKELNNPGEATKVVAETTTEAPSVINATWKDLLRQDLADPEKYSMKPVRLQWTRPEYQEFSLEDWKEKLEKEKLDIAAQDVTTVSETKNEAGAPAADDTEPPKKEEKISPDTVANNTWKDLLRQDLADLEKYSMKPVRLQWTRPEYQEFSLEDWKEKLKKEKLDIAAQDVTTVSETKNEAGAPTADDTEPPKKEDKVSPDTVANNTWKDLLRQDLADPEKYSMKPVSLQWTRPEYQEFSLEDWKVKLEKEKAAIATQDATTTVPETKNEAGSPKTDDTESPKKKEEVSLTTGDTRAPEIEPAWKMLLRADLMIEENMKMKPVKLQGTRREYQEQFSLQEWKKVLNNERKIIQSAIDFLKKDLADTKNQEMKAFELQRTRPEYEILSVKEFRKLRWAQKEAIALDASAKTPDKDTAEVKDPSNNAKEEPSTNAKDSTSDTIKEPSSATKTDVPTTKEQLLLPWQNLLKEDLKDEKIRHMKPKDVQQSREEYKDIPAADFKAFAKLEIKALKAAAREMAPPGDPLLHGRR